LEGIYPFFSSWLSLAMLFPSNVSGASNNGLVND